MTDHDEERSYSAALDTAERLLGVRLERFLEPGAGEPANGADFKRLATLHTFGDAWPRTGVLDTRSRALVSVTIAATLGTLEPLRGQLRIALNPPRCRRPVAPGVRGPRERRAPRPGSPRRARGRRRGRGPRPTGIR
jgi:Carboxymuconolactone decarboxylase family